MNDYEWSDERNWPKSLGQTLQEKSLNKEHIFVLQPLKNTFTEHAIKEAYQEVTAVCEDMITNYKKFTSVMPILEKEESRAAYMEDIKRISEKADQSPFKIVPIANLDM